MSTPAPTTSAALVDLEGVRPDVDAALARHVAHLRARLASIDADAHPLGDAVASMLAGGKRLRAAFCYWSWRAHGGRPGTPQAHAVVGVGAALELFQAAALFHDDVMDDSDTRRGRPAAHRAFAMRHDELGLVGGAVQFGTSAAILLGDLALVASEEAFSGTLDAFAPAAATRAREVFDEMRTEVTVGQYLDVLAQAQPYAQDPADDEARARSVIRAKSARYSVEHPLVLGAALAGAGQDDLSALSGLGLPLGEAFQLRDDLLGVFGDPATTGKPAGDDLREGKRTVLVARALARARARGDDETPALLRERLGDRRMDDETVTEVASAIAATGAADDVEALITTLADRAFDAMDARGWPQPAAGVLRSLAHAAVARTA